MLKIIYSSSSPIVLSKKDWLMMEMFTKEVGMMMCALEKEGLYYHIVSNISENGLITRENGVYKLKNINYLKYTKILA